METLSTPLLFSFLAGFAVLAMLTLTSFVKISVVLLIVRQALGLQQVPSNLVVMALAGFLAVFISVPVFQASFAAVSSAQIAPDTAEGLIELWRLGIAPFQAFMARAVDPEHAAYFVSMSEEIWAGSGIAATEGDFIIQVPAFMVSELTEAFRIGILIYLPFIAIDLAVTTLLMALGMQMVQPNIIATPFKLLAFVAVDGWSRLSEGLIASYASGV